MTLSEIKLAMEGLPREEQYELLRFLLVFLNPKGGKRPKSRIFSIEQIRAWIADDEEGMRQFTEGA